MTRLLFYTDLHAKDQQPSSRTGSYKDDILNKLTEIIGLANKYEVDYLVNGADTFDNKSAWKTSHLLVQEMLQILRGFPGDRHITVIGTHDVPTGQLQKLYQQPLGVLARAGAITVLPYDAPTCFWKMEKATFHGVHAAYDLDKDPRNYSTEMYATFIPQAQRPIVTVAHGMIMPAGRSFFDDWTSADDIETAADVVLYGHPHTPDGIYKNKHGTIFVGPGSVARLGSYPYNRDRTPDVVLLEWENYNWKFHKIALKSARPPEEVFAKVIADEMDENETQARVQAFAEALRTANISDDSWGLEELLTEIRTSDHTPEVRLLAEEIITEVSA